MNVSRPDLTPHWDGADTRYLGALVVVLLVMTAIALGLRAVGRSEKGRALAKDFGARTLGWWGLVLIFIPAVLAGGGVVLAMFAVTAWLAWLEFSGLAEEAVLKRWDLVWAGPLVAAHFLAVGEVFPGAVVLWDAAALVVIFAMRRGARWRALGFGCCVVALSFAPALALRFGTRWLFFAIVVVQAGDVLQYGFGKAIGRRPLAPWLSPKKTWEGLLGGVAATALLGAAMAPVIQRGRVAGLTWGLGLALAGTAGGLAMSAVKRKRGVKDFGRLLPGHGGLMDRFDSLGGAVIFAYAVLAWS